jgi:regulator of sirC expression with transglutaminase-like and TPR domain
LPGHFVVGCFVEDVPFFIDPFEQGAFRTPQDLFMILRANHLEPKVTDLAPIPVREVLCRCCRNLVQHYRSSGDDDHAKQFTEFVDEFDSTYERNTR